eukprot:7597678-Lingulodinium_polyedra.AAC.1
MILRPQLRPSFVRAQRESPWLPSSSSALTHAGIKSPTVGGGAYFRRCTRRIVAEDIQQPGKQHGH